MACKLITNRAFIRKVKNFCKYHPLTSRDPESMIRETINALKELIDSSNDTSLLEVLSSETRSIVEHSKLDELFQYKVVGENNRYIIYKAEKFNGGEDILELYDLLYVPKPKK